MKMSSPPYRVVSRSNFPGVMYLNEGGAFRSMDECLDWLARHRDSILCELRSAGVVLLRGFSAALPADVFPALLRSLGTPMKDYLGGSTPRTRLGSVTYSATELPGEYSIALHHEMSYLPQAPEAICFYCVQQSATGGGSVLAASRRVRAALPAEVESAFRERGVLVTRSLPPRHSIYLASGMSRPWQDVFATDDPARVEIVCRERHWVPSWCDDGTLRLQHGATSAYRQHPQTGEPVWFNQAHYYSPECMLRWAERDGRTSQARYILRLMERRDYDHLNQVTFADGSVIPPAYLLSIWDALVQSETVFTMDVGDIMVLDNYAVMHGRESFSGTRQLQVGLIERIFR